MKSVFFVGVILSLFLWTDEIYAQEAAYDEFGQVIKSTEFSIPVSPAFVMLDATPERIIKPGMPRNFKVDWSLRTYSFQPNLAIEAQPLWHLLYDRAPLSKYQKANPLLKMLSTLSGSVGIVSRDSLNNLAWGFKMNIYRSRDPLSDPELVDSLNMLVGGDERQMMSELRQLRKQADKLKGRKDAASERSRNTLFQSIDSLRAELVYFQAMRRETIRELQSRYINRHWNTSMIDVAFARSYVFDRDVTLDSLSLLSEATGMWVNASVGLGKNWLLSGMAHYTLREISDSFLWGANMRFGNGRYNFFTEFFMQNFTRQTESNSFTIAYGGDFKLSRSVLLNFSLRNRFSNKIVLKEILPIANIICLMR
ncbi:MAG: hypothetical protein IPM47_01225 [Sphingobacteriales bacterium]|nr:MAG: hypothetical protein IPM47_01225 [Sphingobacteriales bacterium]